MKQLRPTLLLPTLHYQTRFRARVVASIQQPISTFNGLQPERIGIRGRCDGKAFQLFFQPHIHRNVYLLSLFPLADDRRSVVFYYYKIFFNTLWR